MNIPNLKNMNPIDRSELQGWCMEVVRRLKALDDGRYLPVGKQVIDARDATVGSGLTTKRQVESVVARKGEDLEDLIRAAVNKLKQDNNLV